MRTNCAERRAPRAHRFEQSKHKILIALLLIAPGQRHGYLVEPRIKRAKAKAHAGVVHHHLHQGAVAIGHGAFVLRQVLGEGVKHRGALPCCAVKLAVDAQRRFSGPQPHRLRSCELLARDLRVRK